MLKIKDKAYLVNLLKLTANEKRLDILSTIKDEPLTVGEISEQCNLSEPIVSSYLNKMRLGGIVSAQQNGRYMRYSIKDNNVIKILNLPF